MTNNSKILVAALLATLSFASGAQAQDTKAQDKGLYIAGQAGLNIPTRDGGLLDEAAVFAAAIGYHVTPNVRVEAELSHRKNDVDLTGASGHIKGTALSVNGYYDFTNDTAFTPYLGLGLGYARGSSKATVGATTIKDTEYSPAWQAIAGVSYDLNHHVALTTDYRYLDTIEADDYSAHEIRAGVRYSF